MIASPIGMLPRSYLTLAAVIGQEEALRLVRLFGGRRISVPAHPTERHWLCAHIGLEALERLASRWGGGQLSVPRCLALRNEEILAQARAGASQAVLAQAHGRTERQVRRILVLDRKGRDKCPQ